MANRWRIGWLGPVAAVTLLMPGSPSIAAPEGTGVAAEAALIAAQRQWVRRDGPRLIFALPGFEHLVFEDRSCEKLEGGDCIHYRLDTVFPASNASQPPLFGLAEQYYEGSSYTLLAPNGEQIDVGVRPLPSSDGAFLVAAASSDGHPPDTGITLLQRIDSDAVMIVRTIPTGALTAYEDLRWIGPRCVAFRAAIMGRGFYGTPQPFTLSAATPEWTLARGTANCAPPTAAARALEQ